MKKATEISINDLIQGKKLDYINQIWLAIMQMDQYALMQLLDDKIDYEDIGREKFVEKLNDRFNDYKTRGDSELLMDLDTCLICKKGETVCKFIGNKSQTKFALFFEFNNGEITDIYHCNLFEGKYDLPF